MATPSPPTEPPVVFGFTTTSPSLWPGDSGPLFDGEWNSSKKTPKSIGTPLRARRTEPPSSVFHSPLCKLWVLAQNMLGLAPPPIEPPAVFFTPLSASLEQNMSGPHHTRPKGSGHAHHPRRPWAFLTFMQEHRIEGKQQAVPEERLYMSIVFFYRINKYCCSRS